MKIVLVPGKFYVTKNNEIWCCFDFDPAKKESAQAQCVRTDGKVKSFSSDGRCKGSKNTIVSMLPYWGADGDARQQFESACEDVRKQVREELREMIDKCKVVLTHANDLVEKLEEALDKP